MFESIFKCSFIEVSIAFSMLAFTVRQPSPPFAFVPLYKLIGLSFFIFLGCEPIELAIATLPPRQKLSAVHVAVMINFSTKSVLFVLFVASFIYSTIFAIVTDAIAMHLSVLHLPEINTVIIADQFQSLGTQQLLKTKTSIRHEFVVNEIIVYLLLIERKHFGDGHLFLCCFDSQYFHVQGVLPSLLLC